MSDGYELNNRQMGLWSGSRIAQVVHASIDMNSSRVVRTRRDLIDWKTLLFDAKHYDGKPSPFPYSVSLLH